MHDNNAFFFFFLVLLFLFFFVCVCFVLFLLIDYLCISVPTNGTPPVQEGENEEAVAVGGDCGLPYGQHTPLASYPPQVDLCMNRS